MTTNFYSSLSCFSSCCLAIKDDNEPACHHLPFLCVLLFQNTMMMTSKCSSSFSFSCSTLDDEPSLLLSSYSPCLLCSRRWQQVFSHHHLVLLIAQLQKTTMSQLLVIFLFFVLLCSKRRRQANVHYHILHVVQLQKMMMN